MDKSLYLFNPENDMALAHGKSRFVIRRSVQKMKDDLSFIPAWYAENGSTVLVESSLMSYSSGAKYRIYGLS